MITDRNEHKKAKELCLSLRKKGLMVFVLRINIFKIKDITRVIKMVNKRNINVIQGTVPKFIPRIVQFYVGVIKAYMKVIFVYQKMNKYITIPDYIEMYKDKWTQKRY